MLHWTHGIIARARHYICLCPFSQLWIVELVFLHLLCSVSVLSFSQPGHISKVSQWFYRRQHSVLQLCVSEDQTLFYRNALFPHVIDCSLERATEQTEQTEKCPAHVSSLCVYAAVWSSRAWLLTVCNPYDAWLIIWEMLMNVIAYNPLIFITKCWLILCHIYWGVKYRFTFIQLIPCMLCMSWEVILLFIGMDLSLEVKFICSFIHLLQPVSWG